MASTGAQKIGKEKEIEIGWRVTSWSSESSGRGRRYVGLRRKICAAWGHDLEREEGENEEKR
jgi:hypothetical protein